MTSVLTRSSTSLGLLRTGDDTVLELLDPSESRLRNNLGFGGPGNGLTEPLGSSASTFRNCFDSVGLDATGDVMSCWPRGVESGDEGESAPDGFGLSGKKYDISGSDVVDGEFMLE